MPFIEENPEKMFYRIGEVADMFGVNPSLIRFWEHEFDTFKPFKNKKGTRFFTKEDIGTFQQIYYLVKERGHTLQSAKDILRNKPETVEKNREIYNSLCKIRHFLTEIKASL
ncbi:MAG: MerR family transcriptional regulator [Bacteroidales bacterium]|nr:MerR family transcriptional regulator [Bacteroidales bacterium]MCR5190798.1 MerR family transcriptional regulator [Bacteroidales bacterium]